LDINEVAEPNYIEFLTKTNTPLMGKRPTQSGPVMLFHDSFATALKPFLQYHFSDIISVNHYKLEPKLIESQKPSVVISEIVERNFNTTDLNTLLAEERRIFGGTAP